MFLWNSEFYSHLQRHKQGLFTFRVCLYHVFLLPILAKCFFFYVCVLKMR